MTQPTLRQRIVPHLIAIGVFLLLVIVYFSPLFFKDHAPVANDVLQSFGAAQDVTLHRAQTGEEPLWFGNLFSGMPSYILNVFFSGDLTHYLRSGLAAIFPNPTNVVLLGFLSFYLLMSVLRIRPLFAFLGAVAFSFCTYTMVSLEAGHVFKSLATAYIPLVLTGMILLYRGRYLAGAAVSGLGVALELGAQHYQITFYLALMLLGFGINELVIAIKEKHIKRLVVATTLFVVAALIGLGPSIGRIWQASEYNKYSIRGGAELTPQSPEEEAVASKGGLTKDYAFSWSNGVFESFTLLIPDLYGGASNKNLGDKSTFYEDLKGIGYSSGQARQLAESAPMYWGDQPFTSGPAYAGVLSVFLFVFAMVTLSNRQRIWIGAAVLFFLAISWGKNFELLNYTLFDYVPGFNRFRSVSMAITIVIFLMPFAGLLALHKLFTQPKAMDWAKKLRTSGIITGALLLIGFFGAASGDYTGLVDAEQLAGAPTEFLDALQDARASLLQNSVLKSLVIAGLGYLLLLYFLKKKLSLQYLGLGLAALMVVDLWSENRDYLNKDDFEPKATAQTIRKTEADRQILEDESIHYRVLNLTVSPFNDATTSYYHRSIGGYHGFKMRRYQDLIERQLTPEIGQSYQQLQDSGRFYAPLPVLDMLNCKYLILPMQNGQAPMVAERPTGHGAAWFVRSIKEVTSADQEMEALANTQVGQTAIVNSEQFELPATTSYTLTGDASIELVKYAPNRLTYRTKNANPGFAVFSEIYYPKGWQVTIDGKEATHLRADYVLRAMELPAGEHEVEFYFHPRSYVLGNQIALASSLVLIASLLGTLVLGWWRRKKGIAPTGEEELLEL